MYIFRGGGEERHAVIRNPSPSILDVVQREGEGEEEKTLLVAYLIGHSSKRTKRAIDS